MLRSRSSMHTGIGRCKLSPEGARSEEPAQSPSGPKTVIIGADSGIPSGVLTFEALWSQLALDIERFSNLALLEFHSVRKPFSLQADPVCRKVLLQRQLLNDKITDLRKQFSREISLLLRDNEQLRKTVLALKDDNNNSFHAVNDTEMGEKVVSLLQMV
ncbi:hypothetical protein Ciccas_004783 [Cichlidogyrus casuarinus]|uniref:Uncharacterized protein n=1 Tax=Cichlidogyrus casuarinus TaxID=1844966 RepID=A0ABD2QAJ5_9PLAT